MKLNSLKVHNISEHWELYMNLKKKWLRNCLKGRWQGSLMEEELVFWRKAIREFFKHWF